MPADSPFDRPRWSKEDAGVVLAELERSGKPVRVFGEEHGIDPQRLHLWRQIQPQDNIRVFHVQHSVDDGDEAQGARFVRVDEIALVAVFNDGTTRPDANVPLHFISGVWLEPVNRIWSMKIGGTLFPLAHGYRCRPPAN